jgi:hypothetical protein
MSDYQARAGSTADLTLRHLRAHGATGEIALAAAIDKDVGDLGALLNWPIKQGAIKKAVVGDEWVYDLGDGVPVAQPIELPKKTPQQGANRDASAGQSHGAGGSESLAGRGTNGAPALGAAPVFSMQASRAGPASDGSQKPNGRAHGSSTAAVRAGSDSITPRRDSQHVLKAKAARPDATDREIHATSSPVGGPMGAGQPAAAGPTDESPSDEFRIALWSDGVLDIRRPGGHLTRFTKAEARAIVSYLESIALDPLREEAGTC